MAGRRSWGIFSILLIVSILLHTFAWRWLELRDWQEPKQATEFSTATTQVVLIVLPAPPPKAPMPEKKILETNPDKHAPMHNAEHFASSNTTDKSVTKITSGEQPVNIDKIALKNLQPTISPVKMTSTNIKKIEDIKKSEHQKMEPDANSKTAKAVIFSIGAAQTNNNKETLPIDKNESLEQVFSGGSLSAEPSNENSKSSISNELLVELGNMKLLDDYHLGEVEVKEPFSEMEAKRIRMVNRYLERMEKQIQAEWMKPETTNKQLAGVIKFSLSPYGYLHEAYIYLGSGNSALDHSALEAVKRVNKFLVPESELLAARYYSNLRFQYSSQDFVGESIPIYP